MKVVSRAPLVPSGSLITCTRMSSPEFTSRRISSTGGWLASDALATVSSETVPAMSAACRNAVRSRPISTNAACMPGNTRDTRPLYRLLTRPRRLVRSMWISCTTPLSSMAARVSRGAMLTRISMLTGLRSRARAVPPVRHARGTQQLRRLEQRQTHDSRVAAAQVLDEHRGAPLDRVPAGLVTRLARVPVGAAFGATEGPEAHLARAQAEAHRAVSRERHGREYLVRAPGEPLEHGETLPLIGGLAAHRLIEHHGGVGGEHRQRHPALTHGERLGASHAHHVIRRAFPGQQRLVDVRRAHHVRHADLRQQLAAPRGGRGETYERCRFVRCHQSR